MKFRTRKNEEFNLLLVKGENQIKKAITPCVRVPKIEEIEPQLISIYEADNISKPKKKIRF